MRGAKKPGAPNTAAISALLRFWTPRSKPANASDVGADRLGDQLPELAQPFDAALGRVAGDQRGVDRADRDAGHPVGRLAVASAALRRRRPGRRRGRRRPAAPGSIPRACVGSSGERARSSSRGGRRAAPRRRSPREYATVPFVVAAVRTAASRCGAGATAWHAVGPAAPSAAKGAYETAAAERTQPEPARHARARGLRAHDAGRHRGDAAARGRRPRRDASRRSRATTKVR